MTLILKYKEGTEIGVDEAGRGPLFGAVYAAAVVIDNSFDISKVKDSKKFTSKKKIEEAYNYIINNAVSYGIASVDEKTIDKINIRQATFKAMHSAIKQCLNKIKNSDKISENKYLLVDGNDFKPYLIYKENMFQELETFCITKGDNTYASIAAASILAKVERDKYIENLCIIFPKLIEYYDLQKNKGYGTKNHIAGINKNGITHFHRKTYNICKNMPKIDL